MVRLEELTVSTYANRLSFDGPVEIIAVKWFGDTIDTYRIAQRQNRRALSTSVCMYVLGVVGVGSGSSGRGGGGVGGKDTITIQSQMSRLVLSTNAYCTKHRNVTGILGSSHRRWELMYT